MSAHVGAKILSCNRILILFVICKEFWSTKDWFQLQPQMIEQCPCVKPPGSNECLSYDNRLQAASIEEALHTFPDLSTMTGKGRPLVSDEDDSVRSALHKSTFEFSVSHKKVR